MPTLTTLVDSTIPVASDFNNNYSLLNQAIGTGTTITTYTTGDILYASAANTLSKLAAGSAGQVLAQGASVPQWGLTAVAGTPIAHGLYRENVVKMWAVATTAATVYTLTDSFNVASLTDGGTGAFTLTIDRDFANTTYAIAGATTGIAFPTVASLAVGSLGITVYDTGGAAADSNCHIIAIGDQ